MLTKTRSQERWIARECSTKDADRNLSEFEVNLAIIKEFQATMRDPTSIKQTNEHRQND